MDKDKKIDDILAMLDGSVKKGDGHINVQVNDIKSDEKVESEKNVSRGCADNSINPMACCVPTIELPDDDEFEKQEGLKLYKGISYLYMILMRWI